MLSISRPTLPVAPTTATRYPIGNLLESGRTRSLRLDGRSGNWARVAQDPEDKVNTMPFDIAALPLATTLGVTLTASEKDRVVGQLTVREEITTGGHILHGGAYMAFADTLGAIGARSEEHTSE